MRSGRLSKEEALSFLLTHLVIERQQTLSLDPVSLFSLMTLAATAESRLSTEEGLIPHEVIEEMAAEFLESQ